MNILFRVLLAFYAFCLTILSVISMIVTFRRDVLDKIYKYLADTVLASGYSSFIMLFISFIFFVLSITFLLSGFKSEKNKRSVSKLTSIGEIKISLNSIENIALSASRKTTGIKDTKARVIKINDSVSITVTAVVLPDINIPALSEDIQNKVKKSVEESSGISVNDVKVVIESIFTGAPYKSRVE